MLRVTRGPPAAIRRGAGPINGRNTIQIAAAIFLTFGLAACVGPYNDDGYAYHGRDAEVRRDAYYDQRRGDNYRNDPFAAQRNVTYDPSSGDAYPDAYRNDPYAARREWRDESWWNDNSFLRSRNYP